MRRGAEKGGGEEDRAVRRGAEKRGGQEDRAVRRGAEKRGGQEDRAVRRGAEKRGGQEAAGRGRRGQDGHSSRDIQMPRGNTGQRAVRGAAGA